MNNCELCLEEPFISGEEPFCPTCLGRLGMGYSPILCLSCSLGTGVYLIWMSHEDMTEETRKVLKEHHQETGGHLIYVRPSCGLCEKEIVCAA